MTNNTFIGCQWSCLHWGLRGLCVSVSHCQYSVITSIRNRFSEFVSTTNGQCLMRIALYYNSESILYVWLITCDKWHNRLPDGKWLQATQHPSICSVKRDTNHPCNHPQHPSSLPCWIPKRQDGKKRGSRDGWMGEHFLWSRYKKTSYTPTTPVSLWLLLGKWGVNETQWP